MHLHQQEGGHGDPQDVVHWIVGSTCNTTAGVTRQGKQYSRIKLRKTIICGNFSNVHCVMNSKHSICSLSLFYFPHEYALLSWQRLGRLVEFFLVFVLPRLLFSLHPADTVRAGGMSAAYRLVFIAALFGFTLLFTWVYRLRVAVERARRLLAQRI
jgi:hypothetical protein